MKILSRRVVLLLMYLVTSATVLFVFMVRPGVDGHPRASFPDMVDGTAHKPFVYRALVPACVRFVAAVTPDSVEEAVNAAFESKRTVRLLGWQRSYIFRYLAALSLMLLSFVGYAWALRKLIAHFFDYQPVVTDMVPIGGLLILPLFFRYYSYLYDPSNLFLFTAAIVLIVTGRTAWFYLLFIVATLNKETSFLLIALLLLYRARTGVNLRLLLHCILLSGIWIAVKGGLAYLYRDHPGAFVEPHLFDHNLRVPFDHTGSAVYFIAVVTMCILVIGRDWGKKPAFLRSGLLITAIPLLILHLFFGYIDELRGYYEALPFVFLLSLPTVARAISHPGNT
jgi:hypothetical protein